MTKTLQLFIVPLGLAMMIVTGVHAQQFQASITNSHWQVVESPLECSLSQDIPGFGTAKFSQITAESFTLAFTTKTQPSVQNNVIFEIAAARWQNDDQRIHLISNPTENGQTSFSIQGPIAKQAFTHIQEGRVPTIRYRSQNITEEMTVLMSTVNLGDSLAAFQECANNIHPYSFDDIRRLTIPFAIEKSELSIGAEQALDRIAEYVKIDDKIKRIMVSGHTDNHGYRRINQPLAEARAIVVKNYLIEQGVPEQLIITSSHIEFKPIATNRTTKGRSLNRRAEIELIRK
jgi:outer membrane protein OmpA-like peptidoglycan-associated protein